jgi:zinc D-Ala-D-Ala carboxypeptidase
LRTTHARVILHALEREGIVATQLSPHFTLEELIHSDFALRHQIDNSTSDPPIIEALKALALNILEPIRAHYGVAFSPTSGYRCPQLNEAIRGASNSQHMSGQAADIVLPGISRLELAQWIRGSLWV